jgi:quinoprotein dehydrogenase-associated probable ABC transporter substrate-binding protein
MRTSVAEMKPGSRKSPLFTLLLSAAMLGLPGLLPTPARAQGFPSKEFEDLSRAERNEAKAAALTRKYEVLRVCGDPGNMPLSNMAGEGYQNKIAEVLANAMGARLTYFWRPYFERGLTRQTFDTNDCDLLMDMPADYASLLTTIPVYRTTYVFAYRNDSGIEIKGLDDPALRKLRIGVFETSALREVLANHGVKLNVSVQEISHDADLHPEHQPWQQVQDVIDRKLDVAAVWGPFAGWLKSMKDAPIIIQPANLMDDDIPMEFSLAIGMRKTDSVLKYAIDNALEARKDEIQKILAAYGVPLVRCSRCVVPGTLPAHGNYTKPVQKDGPAAASIPLDRVEQWLAQGADVNQELDNAVLSSDVERIRFLLDRGADINKIDAQGVAPLHAAARGSNAATVALLLDRKADPDMRDRDGWTPLLHAAFRNRVAAIKLLLSRGADIEATAPWGYGALMLAVEEEKFDAAQALVDAGAAVDRPAGPENLTPLMVVASEVPTSRRIIQITQSVGPIEIARALIARGAKVNAVTTAGVTPVMIAAARDNAPMIGVLAEAGADLAAKSGDGQTALEIAGRNDNDTSVRLIRMLTKARSN